MLASAPACRARVPVAVITDLCIFEPDPATRELLVMHRFIPGSSAQRNRCGNRLAHTVFFAASGATEPHRPPTNCATLRELHAAHGSRARISAAEG
jgi:hypothetical protein